jgi:hypothetical protein
LKNQKHKKLWVLCIKIKKYGNNPFRERLRRGFFYVLYAVEKLYSDGVGAPFGVWRSSFHAKLADLSV